MRMGLLLGSQGPPETSDSGEAGPCLSCTLKSLTPCRLHSSVQMGLRNWGHKSSPWSSICHPHLRYLTDTPAGKQRPAHPKVSSGISRTLVPNFSKKLAIGWCLLNDTTEARRPTALGVTAKTPIPSGRNGGSWVLGPASVLTAELQPPPGERLALPFLSCSRVPSTVPSDGVHVAPGTARPRPWSG